MALFAAASQALPYPAVLYVSAQRNAGLLERLMAAGCRAKRVMCEMVHGEYVRPHRYVYCPTIVY